MCRSPLFDEPAPDKGHVIAPDRIRGMMLGLAIGDALGNTSEGMNPDERRRRHGEIRDYLPNAYTDGSHVGLSSDDTQLAFWTLEHLLENEGHFTPEMLAQKFTQRPIFGIGHTVREVPASEGSRLGAGDWLHCTRGRPHVQQDALGVRGRENRRIRGFFRGHIGQDRFHARHLSGDRAQANPDWLSRAPDRPRFGAHDHACLRLSVGRHLQSHHPGV